MKSLILLLLTLLLFTGCESRISHEVATDTDGIAKIAPDTYVKVIAVDIHSSTIYVTVFCDANGNIINRSTTTTWNEQQGKVNHEYSNTAM